MPGYDAGATQFTDRTYTMQFKDAGGTVTSKTFVPGNSAVTEAQLRAVGGAIAAASNAGLVHDDVKFNRRVADNAVIAFDEAESSVIVEAVLVYQSPTSQAEKFIRIPAPDASIFEADGATVNPDDANITALNTAALTALNAGAGDYAFVRGYKVIPGRKLNRRPTLPTIEEPGVAGLPPEAPGV